MTRKFIALLALLGMPLAGSGCVAAAIGAGAIAVDEAIEDDGEFDPLEEAYDGDDSTAPIIDED